MISYVAWLYWPGPLGEIQCLILISILHRWAQILVCIYDRHFGSGNGLCAIGPQIFVSSAVLWYFMWLDSTDQALLVRCNGWYRYQSLIDYSNIWGVDRKDPSGPEMVYHLLGRTILVLLHWYDMSCGLILLHRSLWVRFNIWYCYQYLIDKSNICCFWIRQTLGVPKWIIHHWAADIW